MNKHKEALQKIEELSSHLNDTFTTMHEINHLATEALQSESMMYSEDEVIGFGIWLGEKYWFNLSTYKWECRNEEGLYEVLDSKQLMELYRQSLQPKTEELKEGLKPCPNHPDVLTSQCGICNGDFPKLEQPKTEESLQFLANQAQELNMGYEPKTEEVERGWTITDRTVIDRQLEAIKTVMGNIKTKEQAIQFLKNAGIELEEEQPTSPSLEKEAEERYPEKFENYTNGIPHGMYGMCDSNYYEIKGKEEGYKANNHLDELEKWVREERYHYGTDINSQELINKLYQLKTKLQN